MSKSHLYKVRYRNPTTGYTVYDYFGMRHFILPLNKIPFKVYLDGSLIVVGTAGTKAKCIYLGGNKLGFYPEMIREMWACGEKFFNNYGTAFGDESILSLEYKNDIYHYALPKVDNTIVQLPTGIPVLSANLIGVVSK